MGRLAAEVKRAAAEVGVEVTEATQADRQQLRQSLLHRFTDGLEAWPSWIWEHTHDEYATRCPDGWRAVGDFTPNGSVTMMFDPSDDDSMIVFRSGVDAVRVLSECYGFEVYFTDQQGSFLLIHNHHDCLIACGTAKEWTQERYPLVPC